MVQILRPHHQIADLEGSLDQLVIGDSRAELVQGDREIRVAHLTGKRLVQRTAKSSRPVHVPPATAKERFEERQTLDVVPVGVPEENRSRHRTRQPGDCSTSARPSTRAPVPQSNTTSVPPAERSSTQDVLPPYRTVDGPGAAIEPRVPQNRMRIAPGCSKPAAHTRHAANSRGSRQKPECRLSGGVHWRDAR